VSYADENIERRKVRFQFLASVHKHPHRAWHLECSKKRSRKELFTKLEVAAKPVLDDIRLFRGCCSDEGIRCYSRIGLMKI
jgi:hypothetical protein